MILLENDFCSIYRNMKYSENFEIVADFEQEFTNLIQMEIGLAEGLVDVKVIAVDATWSGLKFVWRKTDR